MWIAVPRGVRGLADRHQRLGARDGERSRAEDGAQPAEAALAGARAELRRAARGTHAAPPAHRLRLGICRPLAGLRTLNLSSFRSLSTVNLELFSIAYRSRYTRTLTSIQYTLNTRTGTYALGFILCAVQVLSSPSYLYRSTGSRRRRWASTRATCSCASNRSSTRR